MENKDFLIFSTDRLLALSALSLEPKVSPEDFLDAFPGRDVIKAIKLSLNFSCRGQEILLKCKIKAVLKLQCSRCGQYIAKEYADSFDECFPNSIKYINAREDIRQALSLMEPMRVLCRKDCKGRCPQCGADLNKEQCECMPKRYLPFEVLKNLKNFKS